MIYYFNAYRPEGIYKSRAWNKAYFPLFPSSFQGIYYGRINRDYRSDISNPWFKEFGYAKKGEIYSFWIPDNSTELFKWRLLG